MPRTRPTTPRRRPTARVRPAKGWDGRCAVCGQLYSQHPVVPTSTDPLAHGPGYRNWSGARGRHDNPRRQDQGFHWFEGVIGQGVGKRRVTYTFPPRPVQATAQATVEQPPTDGYEPPDPSLPCRICGARWKSHEVVLGAPGQPQGAPGERRGRHIDAPGRPQDGTFHWYAASEPPRVDREAGRRSAWALAEIKAALADVVRELGGPSGADALVVAVAVDRLVEVVELERTDAARVARQEAARKGPADGDGPLIVRIVRDIREQVDGLLAAAQTHADTLDALDRHVKRIGWRQLAAPERGRGAPTSADAARRRRP